ncbi:MAG: succinyldiaminopimelate transaminase [Mycobacteriales bacterium]
MPTTSLPDFPWDRLTPYAAAARAYPDGLIDLSIGTPIDPTPEVVRQALALASDAPGYPATIGSEGVRRAAAGWLHRRFGVTVDALTQVIPTVGSKELVTLLPTLLGCVGPVLFPELAYPSYDVGARIAGCTPVPVPTVDGLIDVSVLDRVGADASLLWVNYPANPHGRIAPPDHLGAIAEWARRRGVLVVSDECYLEFGYTESATSMLAHGADGVLTVHSLSKRSNMAGYRAGFVAGDVSVVRRLLEVRKHAGLIVPAPVQAAMVAALDDDAHVADQKRVYGERRELLMAALGSAGWRVEHSQGGLYLWAAHPLHDCWSSVDRLSKIGILVAPGEFYGAAGHTHVRVALTSPTDLIRQAARRLETLS